MRLYFWCHLSYATDLASKNMQHVQAITGHAHSYRRCPVSASFEAKQRRAHSICASVAP